jgi:type IV pilus biogenesis protein CpaD/CtpE
MAANASDRPDTQESSMGPPPVRTLLFSMLSLLAEVSAHHVGTGVPNVGGDDRTESTIDLAEARLAIDAANALLASVGRALSHDERHAIEGLLTQLQVEYVKRSGN